MNLLCACGVRTWVLLFIFAFLICGPAEAKRRADVIEMKNGDRLSGEVKKLENGILYIETDYFAGSVGVDWSQVASVRSNAAYRVLLKDGNRVEGTIGKSPKGGENVKDFEIHEKQGTRESFSSDVVAIHSQKRRFWSQLTGSVNLGYSFTSGNQQSSLTSDANAKYESTRYFGGAGYTASFGGQSGGTQSTLLELQSIDGVYLNRKSFLMVIGDLLHSTQQDLQLRSTVGGGYGRFIVNTNRQRLVWQAGMVYMNERFNFEGNLPTQNLEGLAGLQYRLFRFDRYTLDGQFFAFPGITDAPRVRTSTNIGFGVKLTDKFRTEIKFWNNFDARPPSDTKRSEFGISNTLGWTF
jgi:putative salt-induced outer membrane protein YdiY